MGSPSVPQPEASLASPMNQVAGNYTPIVLQNSREWPYCPIKRRAARMRDGRSSIAISAATRAIAAMSYFDIDPDGGDASEEKICKRRRRASLADKILLPSADVGSKLSLPSAA